jgi:hypothetical protein
MLHWSRIRAVPRSCFLFEKVAGFERPLTNPLQNDKNAVPEINPGALAPAGQKNADAQEARQGRLTLPRKTRQFAQISLT